MNTQYTDKTPASETASNNAPGVELLLDGCKDASFEPRAELLKIGIVADEPDYFRLLAGCTRVTFVHILHRLIEDVEVESFTPVLDRLLDHPNPVFVRSLIDSLQSIAGSPGTEYTDPRFEEKSSTGFFLLTHAAGNHNPRIAFQAIKALLDADWDCCYVELNEFLLRNPLDRELALQGLELAEGLRRIDIRPALEHLSTATDGEVRQYARALLDWDEDPRYGSDYSDDIILEQIYWKLKRESEIVTRRK